MTRAFSCPELGRIFGLVEGGESEDIISCPYAPSRQGICRSTNYMKMQNGYTWKTLGALTSEANADERVAENIPAVIKGPNPETMLITFWGRGEGRTRGRHEFQIILGTNRILNNTPLPMLAALNHNTDDNMCNYLSPLLYLSFLSPVQSLLSKLLLLPSKRDAVSRGNKSATEPCSVATEVKRIISVFPL